MTQIHKLGGAGAPVTERDIKRLLGALKAGSILITIGQEQYDELMNAQKLLQALINAGVNNWEGYEMAVESLS